MCVCLCVVVKPQDDGGVTDQLYSEMKPAVDGANYIIKHMRNKNEYEVRANNQNVTMLCLIQDALNCVKNVSTFSSTFCIFFSISHTHMFQINKQILIFVKVNPRKYKTQFSNDGFIDKEKKLPKPTWPCVKVIAP